MSSALIYAIKAVILPPGLNLLIAAIGGLLLRRRRRLGTGLIVFSLVVLGMLSLPYVARGLSATLETYAALPVQGPVGRGAQAIVVLGAGRYANAPEYGGDTVSGPALERLRYAANLHARTRLPILLSGGKVFGAGKPEAKLMERVLFTRFHTPARWLEVRSRNTAENAIYSRKILEPLGIRRIFLVTHALHMPRAASVFSRAGFEVIPAPTVFHSVPGRAPAFLGWLPSAHALDLSRDVLHEYLGRIWYAVRY